MSWSVKKACRIERKQTSDTLIWSVRLLDSALSALAIGLCLLWNELISMLDIGDNHGRLAIRLSKSTKPAPHHAIIRRQRNRAELTLSVTELEYLMFFVLRTLRDGTAAVDHIDLEAEPKDRRQKPATLILIFPHAAPPMSGKEVRRRLGL